MIKNTKQDKLKDLISILNLGPEDKVFVHAYSKTGTEDDDAILVSEIPEKLLTRAVKVVIPNCGGQQYGYKLYKFILE